MLCAGREGGGVGGCDAAPGTPLFCSTTEVSRSLEIHGAYLTIASQVSGLKSLSPYGCAIPDFPDMYTSLAYYRDWILDTMAS